MKLNIKGLVFVGFAAAVFASAAQAANDKIVTSKTYVDTKYAGVGNVTVRDGTAAEELEGKKVITVATAEAIADGDGGYATGNQVYDYVTGLELGTTYQPKTTNGGIVVGHDNGTWKTLVGTGDTEVAVDSTDPTKVNVSTTVPVKAVQVNGTALTADNNDAVNITIATGSTGVGTFAVNGVDVTAHGLGTAAGVDTTTDTTFEVAADTGKLPTAATVKAYVDNKATSDLNGKQDKTGANSGIVVGYDNGAWKTLEGAGDSTVAYDSENNKVKVTTTIPVKGITVGGSAVTPDSSTKVVALGAAAGKGADTSITSAATDNNVATSKAVYDYVAAYAPTIQAIPNTCTASTPCALVAAGDGAKWEPIQQ